MTYQYPLDRSIPGYGSIPGNGSIPGISCVLRVRRIVSRVRYRDRPTGGEHLPGTRLIGHLRPCFALLVLLSCLCTRSA